MTGQPKLSLLSITGDWGYIGEGQINNNRREITPPPPPPKDSTSTPTKKRRVPPTHPAVDSLKPPQVLPLWPKYPPHPSACLKTEHISLSSFFFFFFFFFLINWKGRERGGEEEEEKITADQI